MNNISFFKGLHTVINENILNYNTLLISKRKKTKLSRKKYTLYTTLIKQYRILGCLPFKVIKVFKIKKNY